MEELFYLLKEKEDTELVKNSYRNPKILNNLRVFFSHILENNPRIIFIGEAPGYRGAGITGIPFTSGEVIKSCTHSIFKGIKDDLYIEPLMSERTANAFWKTLEEFNIIPIVWNAFPFHPHRKGNPFSNRKPTLSEIHEGFLYLKLVIDIFMPEIFVAVGRVAERSLKSILKHRNVIYVRHPARGGERAFVDGIKRLKHFQEGMG